MARYYKMIEDPYSSEKKKEVIDTMRLVKDAFIIGSVLIIVGLAGCPQYNVWAQGLAGKAALKRAEQDRQITVQEAKAKEESAGLLAKAEIKRASGVAEANKIIAKGLGGPEGYLRYLYIDAIQTHAGEGGQIIYVATEAGLPILEANRLK